MEEIVQNYFIVFLIGLGTMITFHNTILSVRKYFSRRYGKVSDMLRIICNFGNLWRFILSLGYFMAPSNVTSGPCKTLGYLYLIGYHYFHIALYAFTLWTLYRMSNSKKDLWIGIVFLLAQTSFIIPEMMFTRPLSRQLRWKQTDLATELFPDTYCDLMLSPEHYRLWTTIILGFVMVFYVISRITYLARNRKNVAIPTSKEINEDDNTTTQNVVAARRPLSLPTVYLTLTLSLLTFMLILLSSLVEKPDKLMLMDDEDNSIFGLAYKEFLYILISYLITHLDSEKRKSVIFYNCGGSDGNGNLRNSSNKLDGEAWIICSKKEKKKEIEEEKEVTHAQV